MTPENKIQGGDEGLLKAQQELEKKLHDEYKAKKDELMSEISKDKSQLLETIEKQKAELEKQKSLQSLESQVGRAVTKFSMNEYHHGAISQIIRSSAYRVDEDGFIFGPDGTMGMKTPGGKYVKTIPDFVKDYAQNLSLGTERRTTPDGQTIPKVRVGAAVFDDPNYIPEREWTNTQKAYMRLKAARDDGRIGHYGVKY